MQEFSKFTDELVAGGPPTGRGRLFLYVLVDPTEEDVRYVGITINPASRLKNHIEKQSRNRELSAWIDSLKARDMAPLLRVVSTTDLSGWETSEQRWISYLRSQGRLYNIHDGGSCTAFWATKKHPKTLKSHKKRKRRRRRMASCHVAKRTGPPRRVKRVKDQFGLWLPVQSRV